MANQDTRYRKITNELENRIRAGIYPPGSALPPRMELMAEFSVARATIDRCIGVLRRRNLVVSRHGSGTFVKDELHHPYRVAVIGCCPENHYFPEAWKIKNFSDAMLQHKSDWPQLLDFDGAIWFYPERSQNVIIEFLGNQIPQVIVNRTMPERVCVSTDHRGAYYEITRERLDHLPESMVYLLQSSTQSDPASYREAGFIDACRAAQRFYEVWQMPENFEEKIAKLEQLPRKTGKPLLLVSTTFYNTGAVMWFARKHNLQWGEDIYYSDFDNDLSEQCWGIKVTSFIQDYPALLSGAVAELENMLEGKCANDERHTMIFPRRCQGNT